MDITRRGSLARLSAGLGGFPLLSSSSMASAPPPTHDGPQLSGATPVNVRSMGAKGDRTTDDLVAFDAAVRLASTNDQYPASVFVPAGHYRRTAPVKLPNHLALRGEGPASVLNSEHDPAFTAPILRNLAAAGAVSLRLSDLSLYGGSHGLKLDVSGEIADLRFDDVTMLMQSVANIEATQLFQTSKFFGGVLGSAPYGIKVNRRTTNALNSFGLEWTDHSESSLYLRGAEGVLVAGGRFEGGGRAGKAAIDIEDGASITFLGVYFENIGEYLVRLRRVNAISFIGCHFSGTTAGSASGLAPFKWDLDESMVVLRDCHSTTPMPVPGNLVLEGNNVNIVPTHAVYSSRGLAGTIEAAPRPLSAAGEVPLLTAMRVAGTSEPQMLRGECTISLTGAGNDPLSAASRWRGEIAITLGTSDEPVLAIAPGAGFAANGVTVALVSAPGGRLLARYRRQGDATVSLCWSVRWTGACSSLKLLVPAAR